MADTPSTDEPGVDPPDQAISQPHDKYFRSVFSHLPDAASLLRAVVPQPLADSLQWSTLALHPGRFCLSLRRAGRHPQRRSPARRPRVDHDRQHRRQAVRRPEPPPAPELHVMVVDVVAHPHVLGVQGNIQTEYVATESQVQYMAFPRALALAEVAWTPAELRSPADFRDRLAAHRPLLDRLRVRYRPWTP